MIIIVLIVFLIYTSIQEYLFFVERQKLLDRIHAKDYNEYRRYDTKKEVKKEQNQDERGARNWL